MVITSTEAYLGAVSLVALHGLRHGWRRETLHASMMLGTVIFLCTGGDALLTNMFRGASSGAGAATPEVCTMSLQAFVAKGVFLGMTVLGFAVGHKHMPAPTVMHQRLSGLIPGAINGAVIAWYTVRTFFQGQEILINVPTAKEATNYFPVVLGLALVGMLLVMFVGWQARQGFEEKKK